MVHYQSRLYNGEPQSPCIVHHAAVDGYLFASRVWRTSNPIGRVVFLHGIVSHGGWYGPTCTALLKAGFEVHFLDRRGSGLNPRGRGDVNDFRTWTSDIVHYMESLPRNIPCLLIGMSWGGKLALEVASRYPDLLDGLGLVSPGIFALRGANKWQSLLLGMVSRTPLHRLRLTIPLADPALFTSSPYWQRYIRCDPMVLRRVTVRFAWADQLLTREVIASAPELRCPTLLMLAGQDRMIDTSRVKTFIQAAVRGPLVHYDYEQATHTFEFDPVQPDYTRDLIQWAVSI